MWDLCSQGCVLAFWLTLSRLVSEDFSYFLTLMRAAVLLSGIVERDSSLKFDTSFGWRDSWLANVYLLEVLEADIGYYLAAWILT